MQYNVSPSRGGNEDDGSMDSEAHWENTDTMTKKHFISKALESMARVQGFTSASMREGGLSHRDEMLHSEIDTPILNEMNVLFNLQIPGPVPSYLNGHYICESGSRLLFLTIHWIKNLPVIKSLNADLQILLLKKCWTELFVLGLAQCAQALSLPTILTSLVSQLHGNATTDNKECTNKVLQVMEHITKIQDYVATMCALDVDQNEFAYLKLLATFQTELQDSTHRAILEKLQDKSFRALRTYVQNKSPENIDKFPR